MWWPSPGSIGRFELFTENFLLPVGAVLERRPGFGTLASMWGVTLLANLAGLTALSLLLVGSDVLEQSTLEAAGALAETFASRDLLGAFLSAVVAGLLMTLFTWLSASASDDNVTRFLVALVVGFLLAAPSLNHAVVSFGEVFLGIVMGTSDATMGDLGRNFLIAIAGNLLGGLGFVTLTRIVQARGGARHGASQEEVQEDGRRDETTSRSGEDGPVERRAGAGHP